MAEYIERDAAKDVLRRYLNAPHMQGEYSIAQGMRIAVRSCIELLENLHAADVVSRTAYDQTAWERDTALQQLKSIGKGLGERMDDVAPVVHGEWYLRHIGVGHYWVCSICHTNPCIYVTEHAKFCPNCGARMDGEKEDERNN